MPSPTQSATDQLAALEARILDGDTAVSAAAFSKARDAATLEQLHAEAESRRVERDEAAAAAADVEARRQQVHAGLVELAGSVDGLRELYAAAVDAPAALQAGLRRYTDGRVKLLAAAKDVDIVDADQLVPNIDEHRFIAEAQREATTGIQTASRPYAPATMVTQQLHLPETAERANAAFAERFAQWAAENQDELARHDAAVARQAAEAAERAAAEQRAVERRQNSDEALRRHLAGRLTGTESDTESGF
ncbi:MAG: hypothetical protein M3501_02095 [Actinomycetota bacterium]|nr:hypothetical protein [Actinomycetota bacterium]